MTGASVLWKPAHILSASGQTAIIVGKLNNVERA